MRDGVGNGDGDKVGFRKRGGIQSTTSLSDEVICSSCSPTSSPSPLSVKPQRLVKGCLSDWP